MTGAGTFLVPKHRLEALADGVFAIAMTILVLEVKVPELQDHRSAQELLVHLRHLVPTLLAYFFSFLFLGLFWVWHHRLASKLSHLDVPLLGLNLVFLALVSFFPFAAGVLGRYPTNPATLMIYLPTIGLLLLTQWGTLDLALARGCVDDTASPADILAARKRNLRACGIFFLAAIPSTLRVGLVPTGVTLLLGIAFLLALKRAR